MKTLMQQKNRVTKNAYVLLADFSESRMLRQRRSGGRSRGCTCRGHRSRATEVPSDTLTLANIFERAESRACLAPDYIIREIVWLESPESVSLPRKERERGEDEPRARWQRRMCSKRIRNTLWDRDRWGARRNSSPLRIVKIKLEFARLLRFQHKRNESATRDTLRRLITDDILKKKIDLKNSD